ncbi:hypothetical protein B0H14DRAFT_3172414 [Mycena olivaceomarginata]|nr:hypothetical protein B0H14DRAFT_3172414 [Mycena olivaceomarginata]
MSRSSILPFFESIVHRTHKSRSSTTSYGIATLPIFDVFIIDIPTSCGDFPDRKAFRDSNGPTPTALLLAPRGLAHHGIIFVPLRCVSTLDQLMVRLVQLRAEVDNATIRAETAETHIKERDQLLLEKDNEIKLDAAEGSLEEAEKGLKEAKRQVRDLDVNAEQAEQQQLAAEKERDQWEAKEERRGGEYFGVVEPANQTPKMS